jgi:hypothetical protein
MPYNGEAEDGTDDFLFAADSDGIWDASSSPSAPTLDYSWATSTSDPAGWCIWDIFTNDAGARALLVCDEGNGLVHYLDGTGWSVPSVTGVSASNLVFVSTWKNRVWYVEKNSTSAWYSAAGSFAGALTEFNFGSKFSKGGYLKAVYNWTLDSGEGPDDYVVAVSSAGDVVVYQGTDPSSSTSFSLVGVWFIGEIPAGRRIGSKFGGDLLLLSVYGVTSLSDLVRGVNPFTLEGSFTAKINRSVNSLMKDTITARGWELTVHPDLAKIIIGTPKVTGQPHIQLVYDTNVEGWATWEGVPYTNGETFGGELYTCEGSSLYRLTGYTDDLDALTSSDPQPVEWSFLTGYYDFDNPQMEKIMELFRPRFIAQGDPAYNIKGFYDYDLSQIAAATGLSEGSSSVWDTGVWDTAIWGGGASSPRISTFGGSGMGRKVAVAMSGNSKVETTLVDIGVMYRPSINTRGML